MDGKLYEEVRLLSTVVERVWWMINLVFFLLRWAVVIDG